MNLVCVILATSKDLHFLNANIKEIHDIFVKIHIMIGTHFWNGDPENEDKINEFDEKLGYREKISIKRYNNKNKNYMPRYVNDEMYWEGYARLYGTISMPFDSDYILYLDADEIIDGKRFKQWISEKKYIKFETIKLANYWYFREPIYRAKNYIEDSVILVNYAFAYKNKEYLFSNLGRHELYELGSVKIRNVLSIDNIPMIHHYSWVRSKEDMIKKCNTWGHKNDLDWKKLIEEEFSRPFNGTDFVKKLDYDIVENFFNI